MNIKFLLSKWRDEKMLWKKQNVKITNVQLCQIFVYCALNNDGTVLKLHDMCDRSGSKRQKQLTISPKQYMLEVGSIKCTLTKIFKGTEKAWNKFLRPAHNMGRPLVDLVVSARTTNPQIGKARSDILKSIWRGGVLSLTDLHGNGLWFKVTLFNSKKVS